MVALVASAPRGFHSSCNPIAGFIYVMIPPEAESRLNGQPALGLAAGPQVQCFEDAIELVWPTRRNIHRRLRAICIRDCVGICGGNLGSWALAWDVRKRSSWSRRR